MVSTMAPAGSFLIPAITTSRRGVLPHFPSLARALLSHWEHNRARCTPELGEPLEGGVEDRDGLRGPLPEIWNWPQFGEDVLLVVRCRRRWQWRWLHGRKWRGRRAGDRHGNIFTKLRPIPNLRQRPPQPISIFNSLA